MSVLPAILVLAASFGPPAPVFQPVFEEIRRLEKLGQDRGLSTDFLRALPGHLEENYLLPLGKAHPAGPERQAAERALAEQLLAFVQSLPLPPQKNTEFLSLASVQAEAARRKLPLGFFQALEKRNAIGKVRLYSKQSPTASFDRTWNLIYLPETQFRTKPAQWSTSQWRAFYNECFHAYYDIVFTNEHLWDDVDALDTSPHRDHYRRHFAKYEKARPSAPLEAMEEAYSETVAALAWLIVNGVPEEKLGYKIGYTVEAVGHFLEGEEDPQGYTKEAESTYPSPEEYEFLFRALTGHSAPKEN